MADHNPYFDVTDLPSCKKNGAMKKAVGLIKSIAQTDITVLLTGESGVGKEVFAKTLHRLSTRNDHQMVGLNCASVPATMLEGELFGCERGAYTGAVSRRMGKFELAQNGTLLLDEIGELDLNLQSKILRVIQEKEIFRLGGEEKINLDIRLIAATNRDLREWVKAGHFREDLFYRLNVISIHVPSLRDRLEDVPVLAEYIIAKFNQDNPGYDLKLTMDAIEQLCKYSWPGNIRELENILIRTAYMNHGHNISHIFFDENRSTASSFNASLTGTLADMERQMILQALETHDGNRMRVADVLGISVRTLRNKLRLYREQGILPPLFAEPAEDSVNLSGESVN